MRSAFRAQLDSFIQALSQKCALAGTAMGRGAQPLQVELLAPERVVTDREHLVRVYTEAKESAFVRLGLQAPPARDLRLVVGTIQNVSYAGRMGELGVRVAKLARRRHPDHAVPEEVNG